MLDACLRMDEMLRSGATRAGQIDYSLNKSFRWVHLYGTSTSDQLSQHGKEIPVCRSHATACIRLIMRDQDQERMCGAEGLPILLGRHSPWS